MEQVKFQDFGNEVYWPGFDYPGSLASDKSKDGCPELYLSDMGHSDGIDSKLYRQIGYTYSKTWRACVKSKGMAYYPAGNEDDA